MPGRRRTGGSRGSGGYSYQDECGAYFATLLLSAAALPLDWSTDVRLSTVRVEVPGSFVDIVLRGEHGGVCLVEAKRNLRGSSSEFASAIRHFVELYHNFADRFGREYLRETDRLMFAVGPRSDVRIKRDLREILRRYETIGGWPAIADATSSDDENEIFERFLSCVRESWEGVTQGQPSEEELVTFFRAMRVIELDLAADGTERRNASDLLRAQLVTGNVDSAWESLCALAQDRSTVGNAGFGREDLVSLLLRHNIEIIGGPINVDNAIVRLSRGAETAANNTEQVTVFRVSGSLINLRAAIATDLYTCAEEAPIFVVGEPGIGKSRTLVEVYRQFRGRDLPALLLSVGSPFANRVVGEDADRLLETMAAWTHRFGRPGALIVDGLDSARAADQREPFVALITAVGGLPNWTVIASMRRWNLAHIDADHDDRLTTVFDGTDSHSVPEPYRDPQFARLRCFAIPTLKDSELKIVEDAVLSAVTAALSIPNLRALAVVPFNLELLVRLVELEGTVSSDLEAANTQPKLIRLYWQKRVGIGDNAVIDENALRLMATEMIRLRQTSLGVEILAGAGADFTAIERLTSAGVIEEVRAFGTFGGRSYGFTHSLFFDYAVAAHVLNDERNRSPLLLGDTPALTLITPSIEMYFDMRWEQESNHTQYWDEVLGVCEEDRAPAIVRALTVSSAARKARTRTDLEPLCAALSSPHRRAAAVRATDALVRSLESRSINLFMNGGHPWSDLLQVISERLEGVEDAATSFRLEQDLLDRRDSLRETAYRQTAAASRALLDHLLQQ